MFCPNCGTQNTETAQTCAKCGFQLKTAAAPKFKGTMLMMNQPGSIPGAPPRPVAAPQAPAAPASMAGAPSSGPGFTAEAPPIGAGGPPAGAGVAAPSRLKGTIVGVAPPNFGAAPGAPSAPAAPGTGAGAGSAPDHQTFGSAADANPLAGTMALDGPPNFANVPGAPQVPSNPAYGAPPPPDPGGFNPPAFGAPPPDTGGGFNPPPFGAPPPPDGGGGGFGPPPGGDPYGAPPAGAGGGFSALPPGGGFGPLPGGDIYGAPPGGPGGGGGAYGALPAGPAPQDYGAQMNQGFQQAGHAFGQAADQFGNAMNPNQPGAMQPYQGGNPMQAPGMGMGGMPGAMTAGDPPKQFMITLLLALFAGGFGAHRFYTGHIVYGVIQLCTVGGCGIWALIDIIMIVTGKYTDAQGRPLQK